MFWIFWMAHKSSILITIMYCLKSADNITFLWGFGVSKPPRLIKNNCVNEMFLQTWKNQHACVCIIANELDVSCSSTVIQRKGLNGNVWGVQMQTPPNMWLFLTIPIMTDTTAVFHQLHAIHSRVRGDRLHVCLHGVAYW